PEMLHMRDLDLAGRRVLIREDLNVPVVDGRVQSSARIDACVPTLRAALAAGARVMVLSHLGRPTEGRPDAAHSLAPVAKALSQALQRDVPLVETWLAGAAPAAGDIVLCENTRSRSAKRPTTRIWHGAWRRCAISSSWMPSALRTGRRRPPRASLALHRSP